MYGIAMLTAPLRFGNAIAVCTLDDLTYLIKEREVLTGLPGREFFVASGRGKLRYGVTTDGTMFGVTPCQGRCDRLYVLPEVLVATPLGLAMTAARLFTEAI